MLRRRDKEALCERAVVEIHDMATNPGRHEVLVHGPFRRGRKVKARGGKCKIAPLPAF
ncbi:hypothetical protein ACFL09_03835 [Planctomycetota bacterium]